CYVVWEIRCSLLGVLCIYMLLMFLFFFQAEDGIRDDLVTGVQTCALPISLRSERSWPPCVRSGRKRVIPRSFKCSSRKWRSRCLRSLVRQTMSALMACESEHTASGRVALT